MKKLVSVLLAAAMVMTLLAGCGGAASGGDGSLTAYVLAEKGDTYSLGLANNFKTAFEAKGGTVVMETFPTNTTNFSDYLQKAMDNRANVIFAPASSKRHLILSAR
ncbi:MAG: hypothetical protein J6Y57_02610 [Lachnospiraceae bacterium]|nr:hypothetical protein [Lachnospiraceae bacterium]